MFNFNTCTPSLLGIFRILHQLHLPDDRNNVKVENLNSAQLPNVVDNSEIWVTVSNEKLILLVLLILKVSCLTVIFYGNLTVIFFIWVFFNEYSWFTGQQGKGEAISLTPHCHFHPLHRHLDISRVITSESSPSAQS